MEKILEVRNLCKSYGDLKAVDNLNLDVYRGDVFGFLGPNGAGKSTSLRMLLGLIKPDAGTIKYFGKDFSSNRNDILGRIGCIVEKPDFYKYLSGKKNLELLARISGLKVSDQRLEELLEFVGLRGRGDDSVKAYSHGMKQRLGIAQALLHDPELIILDEPTTGLDPQGIVDIRKLLRHLAADLKKTVILSSHILSETEMTVNRLAIMNKGKLAAQGEITELLHDENAFVFYRVDDTEKAHSLLMNSSFSASVKSVKEDGVELQLNLDKIGKVNAFLVENGINVTGIESRRQLEDYFFRLTESAERMKVA
jgi:ABC-type multidrug transport system ATPase subunit